MEADLTGINRPTESGQAQSGGVEEIPGGLIIF